MSAADLPGGLAVRECSPGVLLEHENVPPHLAGRRVRVGFIDELASVTVDGVSMVGLVPLEAIALDLTHGTGRAHAAWHVDAYVAKLRADSLEGGLRPADEVVLDCARRGRTMSGKGQDRLRDLVLMTAERVKAKVTI